MKKLSTDGKIVLGIGGLFGFLAIGIFTCITLFIGNVVSEGSESKEGKAMDEMVVNNEDWTLNWSEEKVIDVMHKMVHQKVEASEKWGAIEMTQHRIEVLIEVAEENDHSEEVLEILYDWKAGDFSHADKDHNALWNMQGGTVGIATGLASEEEEQKFIEEYIR